MKLGLYVPDYTWSGGPDRLGATLGEIARTADGCGFETIAVPDHVWQHPYTGGTERAMLECYATLSFVAAHTSRARLIGVVSPVHFRYPGLLAKTVTTLDVLSGGRAWLGLGAGYYEEESRGLGIPFPPTEERYEMLEETLQICLQMWRGDEHPFEGAHYRLDRPLNSPQSLTRPHPPIVIGGAGEQKTLRLVARYADACNLYPTPELPHKLEVLRRHCEAEGRDYEAIEKTCMLLNVDVSENGSKAGEATEQLRKLAGMGVQTVIASVKDVDRIRPLEVLGREVIPAIADL
jgi:F420-dependent oxidoreductase-like protein